MPRSLRFKIFNIKKIKLFKTKTGNYYLPFFAFRDVVRNTIINDEVFDNEVYELSKTLIQENSIVIDAGANYGQLSILFSQSKSNVTVYAFEAYKYIYEILLRNVKINNATIKVFNYILGDSSKKDLLISNSKLQSSNNYGSNKVELASDLSEGNLVDAVKIDDLEFEKKISFMKIDVQGYDLKVLNGAKKTIQKHKMPIIIEYSQEFEKDFNYTFYDFETILKELNYKIEKKIEGNNYLIIYDDKLS